MSKLKLALVAFGATVFVPGVALAAHTMNCCGDVWCCLRHLGCC
jgi:hypothetical protein